MLRRFPFAFAFPYWPASAALGITPMTAHVDVDTYRGSVHARFGPWQVTTTIDNIKGTHITGGYRLWKTIGPPHISFTDRGLTMATNSREGVCLEFVEPVRGALPTSRLRHPGLTVTVADCRGLIEAIS